MSATILIQKSIQRQATARKRLPSPMAQFKTFLNRGSAKAASPENGGGKGEVADIAQNAPKTPQGASVSDEGNLPPPPPADAQGRENTPPASDSGAKGARKRGKRGA